MNRQFTLRTRMLWFPGILIIIIGISIQAYVVWLYRYNAFVNKHAIACELDVDLSKHGIEEKAFVPLITRDFVFGFVLRTYFSDDVARNKHSQDIVSSNYLKEMIKNEEFKLSWQLYRDDKKVADGTISEKNLGEIVHTPEFRYLFSRQNIPLRAGQSYKLTAEVITPSEALGAFSPALIIRTFSTLKGCIWLGWKMQDTLLCIALGFVLITSGLLKQCLKKRI